MSDRFAPPLSAVEDRRPRWSPPPRGVALAVRFLWISLALGLPSFAYEFNRSPSGVDFAISVAFQVALLAFGAYINVSIYRARNWARIVALILTVLETGMLLFGLTSADAAVIEVICNWVATALDIAAMGLLFTATASAWFRRKGGV